jgi:predicted restriction endonuclease
VGQAAREKRAKLSPEFCEWPDCDWEHAIQRHRIEPGRNGGRYKNGNVISLCPNHHWLADRELEPCTPGRLLAIVERRAKPNR